MSTRIGPLLAWAALLSSAHSTAQNDYYVNGLSGQDLPGNGTSQQTPWRTITYAFTQIPPPSPGNGHALRVASNQVYSPATNGETFPIVPTYNVAILGQQVGARAILRIPPNQTGIAFNPNTVYNRDQSKLSYLTFDGGAVGVSIGGSATNRHRPKVDLCDFVQQTTAGIQITTSAVNIDDPRFFTCRFDRCQYGVLGSATGNAAILRPDIDECTFTGNPGAGILIEDNSLIGSDVGGLIRNSQFYGCERGVELLSGINAQFTRLDIQSCYFGQCVADGISLQVLRPADPLVTVDSCSFVDGDYGLRVGGVFGAGLYTFTVRNCFAFRQRTAGFAYGVGGAGNVTINSSGNLAQAAGQYGFVFVSSSVRAQLTLMSAGDRALGGLNMGLLFGGKSLASTMTVENGIFAGNGGDGVFMQLNNLSATLRFATMADNRGAGLRGVFPATLPAIHHCVFAANGGGEVQVPQGTVITYSAFQNQPYAGTGNVQVNPQLLRPYYKLAPGSPCIDAGNPALTSPPATDFECSPRVAAGRPAGQPIPDMGADEFVPAGNVCRFGIAGIGRPGFLPSIQSPNSTARVGQPLVIDVANARDAGGFPATAALLFAGFSELPALFPPDQAPFGAPGSFFWTDLDLVIGAAPVNGAGTASLTLPIPADPLLAGNPLVLQWLVFRSGINAAGFLLTDAMRVTIGQ